MTFNLARAVGPALAALAVVTVGIPAAFAINSVSYLAIVVALLFVQAAAAAASAVAEAARELALRARRTASARVPADRRRVGYASDPINTLAPAFAEAYGRKDTFAGFIVGVFGLGAVTAALVVAGRSAGSAARMALTLTLLAGGVIGFSLSPWLPLGFVFLFIAGFGYLSRTRPRRPGSSSASRRRSAAGSWRSGASPSSASGHSRA